MMQNNFILNQELLDFVKKIKNLNILPDFGIALFLTYFVL